MVWCIAAIDGLANAYEINMTHQNGSVGINFTMALRRFAIGFNRGAHHTFNFIDVGGGNRMTKLKEVTDSKLRDTFTMSESHIDLVHLLTDNPYPSAASLQTCIFCGLP